MIVLPAKSHLAAFDVDAQKTFTPLCPDELPVAGGDAIVDELNAQASLAGYRLGSKDTHPDNAVWLTEDPDEIGAPLSGHPNAREKWVAHARVGSTGFDLIDGLPHPSEYSLFVYKGAERDMHPYGACFHDVAETVSTGAIEFLRDRRIEAILVGGLATDFCVRATVLQLLEGGFRVLVNRAAVRGITEEGCHAAEAEMSAAGAEFFDGVDRLSDLVTPVDGR